MHPRPSGGFRPGPRGHRPSPSFATGFQFRSHSWFFAKITQISDFFAFRNFRKVGKFEASIERRKAKVLQLHGGFAFWPPDHQELYPRSPLGTPTPGPRYRLALPRSPWHGVVPLSPDVAGWNHHCDNHTQCQGSTHCRSFLQENTPSVASGGGASPPSISGFSLHTGWAQLEPSEK